MFRGATLVNLDSKGRLAVPTRYRETLIGESQGQMVCTIDLHQPCLLLYTLPEWEIIERKLARLSSMNRLSVAFNAFYLGMPVNVRWIAQVVCWWRILYVSMQI